MDSKTDNNVNNSILILRPKTRKMIINLMNPPKFLRNEKGLPRDWQGLAELCGISGELMPSIAHDLDRTAKVLKLWYDQSKTDATIDKLISFLEQLDRLDVVDDILPLIDEDLKYHETHQSNGKVVETDDEKLDKDILTNDDIGLVSKGLAPQRYDAFLLYDQNDIAFASEVLETMEKQYNLKLCVKDRDLVPGTFEHSAVIRLIAERCKRLIVILSDEFKQSSSFKFFYDLAQSISIANDQRKIIPLIYKDCGKLPAELDCYFKLDYRRSGTFFNFWERLFKSIKGNAVKEVDIPRSKLSLPDGSLFPKRESAPEFIENSIYSSSSEQYLSPSGLRSSLHKENSAPRSLSPSVTFGSSSSMNKADETLVPQNSIVPSTSTNSLGRSEMGWKWFPSLKKIKRLVPKSKTDKNQTSGEEQMNKTIEKNNKENSNQNCDDRIAPNNNQTNDITINPEKKKKKIFTLKRNKKKIALPEC